MPNTQTSVPAFTAGQVLTAQQQTEINTGIPVFATTVTRDAAFGGAGEKALAEGQFAYIEATNITQYYDGAAWQSVGTSGFTFITGTTFSAVSSVSLPTDTFTSTYDNYRMIFQITGMSSAATITMRMRASGTDNSTSNYYNAFTGLANDGTTLTRTSSGGTSFAICQIENFGNPHFIDLNIYNPKIASQTNIGGLSFTQSGGATSTMSGGGNQAQSTAFDSLSIITSTGTITGKYRIYGYANS